METTISFGKIAANGKNKTNEVEVTMRLKQTEKGPVFTASANVWNSRHTDIVMGGQCLDDIKLDNPLFDEIRELWRKHHLNDMHAGTEKQEETLQKHESATGKKCKSYEEQLKVLEMYNIAIDWIDNKPYKYGTKWLYREIPTGDLERIRKIMEENKK